METYWAKPRVPHSHKAPTDILVKPKHLNGSQGPNGAMKDVEIAKSLTEMSGRKVTLQAVRKMRQKLGVKKKCGRGVCGLIDLSSGKESF